MNRYLLPGVLVCTLLFNLHAQVNPFEKAVFPEVFAPSSSCSFVDVNQDGFLDVFVTTGEKELDNQLFFGSSDGTFEQAIIPALTGKTPTYYSYSGAWGDYDNDGDLDVYISNNNYLTFTGQNCFLVRNDGNNTFTRLSGNNLVDDINPGSYGAAWGDYDNDGLLDIFIANSYGKSVLYKNTGNTNFQKINLPGIISEDAAIGGSWIDYNNDDCLDLYILNRGRRENNVLLKNNCNGTFSVMNNDLATLGSFYIWGNSRSINWSDFDRDGDLDAAIVNYDALAMMLFENKGNDIFLFRGTHTIYGRAATVADINNDGWEDIVATESNSIRYFLNNKNFTFTDYEINIEEFQMHSPWTLCSGDYNNDGKIDLFVACRFFFNSTSYSNNILLKNVDANCNNWLSVAFNQSNSNRLAIGAKIWCYFKEKGNNKVSYKQVQSSHSGNYQSYNGQYMHFGLGEETLVDSIVVRWPNHALTRYYSIKANQRILLYDDGGIHLGNPIEKPSADTLQIKVFSIDVGCERKVAYLYYDFPVDWYDATTNTLVSENASVLLNPDSTHQYYFRTLCQQSDTLDIPKYQKANCADKCFKSFGVIPNLITPNKDDKNDVFEIPMAELSPEISLQVFNLWGTKLFESKDYQNNWNADGLDDGIYYYHLKMESDTECEQKGWVQILR